MIKFEFHQVNCNCFISCIPFPMTSFAHFLAYSLDRDKGAIPPKLPIATIDRHVRTDCRLHLNALDESRTESAHVLRTKNKRK